MTIKKIKLTSVNEVKNFVNIMMRQVFEAELVSGRFVVDAKSIMGIFSLDLSHPVELRILSDDESVDKFLETIKNYIEE